MWINLDKKQYLERVRTFSFLFRYGGTNLPALRIAGAPSGFARDQRKRLVHFETKWVYLIGTFIREIQARYGRRAAKIASFFTLVRARVCPIQKSRLSFGKEKNAERERRRKGGWDRRGMQEDVCLVALDKIASLLIKFATVERVALKSPANMRGRSLHFRIFCCILEFF